jgi:hypothetical protein
MFLRNVYTYLPVWTVTFTITTAAVDHVPPKTSYPPTGIQGILTRKAEDGSSSSWSKPQVRSTQVLNLPENTIANRFLVIT